ncbi:hypothetical protein B0F90DRAFT_1807089 [Multifurca ochricompacta]|uniref:Gfd2/YDR514C-like C-terminal domain-containing protein n=1 Tax=Multifurca ochricompacta TaxID=376703 RepID=A0AAD4QRI8_9AGAM|nr:hypothetical protein B0F90DRAFT_1807089 [Multifurca ochricompacta]
MSDFHLVDSQGWEYDLQSVYAAYMGYFQLNGIPWYERSWGHLFNTFEDFLSFSWPVITATDAYTGRAHIVTRMTSVGAFVKMIKTRFGDTLPLVDNVVKVNPFETHQRHLRTISDYSSYKKLHATLRAVYLSALKARIRLGEPRAIQELWDLHDKSFLAIDFESSERNAASVLEWGYAAVRCGHLDALGAWPPIPEENYRRGHYIVSEYADKIRNKLLTYPWQYAFGESQIVSKVRLPQVIQAVISSLASPDSETQANSLVLVTHSAIEDLRRFEEMKIKLPQNLLIIDVSTYESCLFKAGLRGAMLDAKTGLPRQPSSLLSLRSILHSLHVSLDFVLHNSGNDALACLLVFQMLVDPKNTQVLSPRTKPPNMALTRSITHNPVSSFSPMLTPHTMAVAVMPRSQSASPQAPHFDKGESLTNPRRSPTLRNRLSVAPDEEGRIRGAPDTLSNKFAAYATIG